MTSFTAKTLFVCFDFVFAAVFTLLTTRTTTAAATEFTQVAAMAAPCNFLIHSKLISLQASYTPATLCDWCVVSYCCRLLCELRYRCVQPTVLCYGRESSTQQQYTAACRAQQWANTTEEVDGEPTATANTFHSSTIAVRPLCRITHTLLQWCNGGRECLMCVFIMDAAAELGRNPVSKHQIQPEYGDEQADAGRDG